MWLTWFEARSGGEMAEVGSGRGVDRLRAIIEKVSIRRWVVLNFMALFGVGFLLCRLWLECLL